MNALVYSPAEVAALMNRSSRTVYDMLRTGELPGRQVRGRWLIRKVDLDAFLAPSGVGRGAGNQPDPNSPSKSAA
jgi:excisionase family DNA binding protein